MKKDLEKKLKEFFKEEELEWKPQSLGVNSKGEPFVMVLCYIQARAIQDRLDEVMGIGNWKDEYRITPHGVICRLSLYDSEAQEWVAKENGSPETDIESFKGGISGAFKRVASSGWGIGRYLYSLDDTNFAECSYTKLKGYEYAKDKKNSKNVYWKKPSIGKKYLPKGEESKAPAKISPHGELTTEQYLFNAETKLNECHTMEQLEACKKVLMPTYTYFKDKIKDEVALGKFKKLVADKEEQILALSYNKYHSFDSIFFNMYILVVSFGWFASAFDMYSNLNIR